MSDEECKCPDPPLGSPLWMATFADLMSLLMCFFVLLLSFSEMDVMKFKRLAGSMAESFGVQNKLKVTNIPKGTSIIAQEFSPGRPEPTPINEIWQKTNDLTEMSLDIECAREYELEQGEQNMEAGIKQSAGGGKLGGAAEHASDGSSGAKAEEREAQKKTEQDAIEIAKALATQIAAGEVEVEAKGRRITIRIREKGAFSSGSAELKLQYRQVLADIRDLLVEKEGSVSIEGHSDDQPISTARYRSNWDLSAARAASVAHEMLRGGVLEKERFTVIGYASTKPLAPNDSRENRARNRRVEMVIFQGSDTEYKKSLNDLRKVDPYYNQMDVNSVLEYEMPDEEIF